MTPVPTDGAGAPLRWMIVFRRDTAAWWVRLLAWGEYKHVRAFAYVGECDTYIFYDVARGRTSIFAARGAGARALMLDWTKDADVLAMSPVGEARRMPVLFLCTTTIRHLLGLPSGALRPDRLFRDCLDHGAELIHGTRHPIATADSAGHRAG